MGDDGGCDNDDNGNDGCDHNHHIYTQPCVVESPPSVYVDTAQNQAQNPSENQGRMLSPCCHVLSIILVLVCGVLFLVLFLLSLMRLL